MKEMVRIQGWDNCPFHKEIDGCFSSSYRKIWYSDDNKRAVIEVWGGELFVAVTIDSEEETGMICTYFDHYTDVGWNCCKVYNGVSWCLEYGYAKLQSFDIETGISENKRLYFDRKLYLDKYLEENGKPKTRAGKVVTEDML